MTADGAAAALEIANLFRSGATAANTAVDMPHRSTPSSIGLGKVGKAGAETNLQDIDPKTAPSSPVLAALSHGEKSTSAGGAGLKKRPRSTDDDGPSIDREPQELAESPHFAESFEHKSADSLEFRENGGSTPLVSRDQEDGELDEINENKKAGNEVSEVVYVPKSAVGFVIGRNGESIKSIIAASGATIDTDPAHGCNTSKASFTVSGRLDDVRLCTKLIQDKLNALDDRSRAKDSNSFPGASISSAPSKHFRGKSLRHPSQSRDSQPDVGTVEEEKADEEEKDVWVPLDKVGLVIGVAGANIRALRETSGAFVQVVNDFVVEGKKRFVLAGAPNCVQVAQEIIEEIVRNPANAANIAAGNGQIEYPKVSSSSLPNLSPRSTPSGDPSYSPRKRLKHARTKSAAGRSPPIDGNLSDLLTKKVYIPSKCVGNVIGRGGETIRDLGQRSGAYIRFASNDDSEDSPERLLTITGTSAEMDRAYSLLSDIVPNLLRTSSTRGGCDTFPTNQLHSDSACVKDVIYVAAHNIGLVIGKEGIVVREMQSRSGAFIEVAGRTESERRGSTRAVIFKGTPSQVSFAKKLILEKLEGADCDSDAAERREGKKKNDSIAMDQQACHNELNSGSGSGVSQVLKQRCPIEYRLGRRVSEDRESIPTYSSNDDDLDSQFVEPQKTGEIGCISENNAQIQQEPRPRFDNDSAGPSNLERSPVQTQQRAPSTQPVQFPLNSGNQHEKRHELEASTSDNPRHPSELDSYQDIIRQAKVTGSPESNSSPNGGCQRSVGNIVQKSIADHAASKIPAITDDRNYNKPLHEHPETSPENPCGASSLNNLPNRLCTASQNMPSCSAVQGPCESPRPFVPLSCHTSPCTSFTPCAHLAAQIYTNPSLQPIANESRECNGPLHNCVHGGDRDCTSYHLGLSSYPFVWPVVALPLHHGFLNAVKHGYWGQCHSDTCARHALLENATCCSKRCRQSCRSPQGWPGACRHQHMLDIAGEADECSTPVTPASQDIRMNRFTGSERPETTKAIQTNSCDCTPKDHPKERSPACEDHTRLCGMKIGGGTRNYSMPPPTIPYFTVPSPSCFMASNMNHSTCGHPASSFLTSCAFAVSRGSSDYGDTRCTCQASDVMQYPSCTTNRPSNVSRRDDDPIHSKGTAVDAERHTTGGN